MRAENVGGAEMQAARGLSLGVSPSLVGRFCAPPAVGGLLLLPWAEVVPLLVLSAALRSSSACVGADLVGVCRHQVAQNDAE